MRLQRVKLRRACWLFLTLTLGLPAAATPTSAAPDPALSDRELQRPPSWSIPTSTDIRQRIAATSIDSVPPNWLNPAVAQYIITHNLYH